MLDTSPESLAKQLTPLSDRDVPAAWWITDSPLHLDEWDASEAAYETWHAAVVELARDAGSDNNGVVLYSGFGDLNLAGFQPVDGHDPAPGWRLDSKSHLIVPSRRTRADRLSDAGPRFAGLKTVPGAKQFVTGISHELRLPGMWYGLSIIRRGQTLVATCGGDPDRAAPSHFDVDETWRRLPLSTFHLIREREEAKAWR